MDIDKQQITAVQELELLGYTYQHGAWTPPFLTGPPTLLTGEADAMHAALLKRADVLMDVAEGAPKDAELKNLIDVIEAYEEKRWPLGVEPGRAVEAV